MSWTTIPSGWYADPTHQICQNCKHFKGEGTLCDKTNLYTTSSQSCYTSKYRIRVLPLRDGVEIDVSNVPVIGAVEIEGEYLLVYLEPIFPFEPK